MGGDGVARFIFKSLLTLKLAHELKCWAPRQHLDKTFESGQGRPHMRAYQIAGFCGPKRFKGLIYGS